MTVDYWLLAAPLVGSAVNVVAQIILARMLGGERLLLVIIASFCAGLVAAGAMTGSAFSMADLASSRQVRIGGKRPAWSIARQASCFSPS